MSKLWTRSISWKSAQSFTCFFFLLSNPPHLSSYFLILFSFITPSFLLHHVVIHSPSECILHPSISSSLLGNPVFSSPPDPRLLLHSLHLSLSITSTFSLWFVYSYFCSPCAPSTYLHLFSIPSSFLSLSSCFSIFFVHHLTALSCCLPVKCFPTISYQLSHSLPLTCAPTRI